MLPIVRTLGVAWVGALCFVFAFFVSRLLDAVTPPLDEKAPKWRVGLAVTLQFAIIGAIVYIARSVIKKIPFPLEGAYGYTHAQLGELRSLPLMVFIFMFFQTKTQEKMKWLSG
jgi:hypothetical protein